MEVGIDNKLNFLNTTLIIDSQRIIFNTYHKTIFSERFFNFHSNHPLCHNVDKIVQLSHPRFQHKNQQMQFIFLNNVYPLFLSYFFYNKRLKFHIQTYHI